MHASQIMITLMFHSEKQPQTLCFDIKGRNSASQREGSSWLYLPNHVNRIIKVWVNDHRLGDGPIAVCCNDANIG